PPTMARSPAGMMLSTSGQEPPLDALLAELGHGAGGPAVLFDLAWRVLAHTCDAADADEFHRRAGLAKALPAAVPRRCVELGILARLRTGRVVDLTFPGRTRRLLAVVKSSSTPASEAMQGYLWITPIRCVEPDSERLMEAIGVLGDVLH